MAITTRHKPITSGPLYEETKKPQLMFVPYRKMFRRSDRKKYKSPVVMWGSVWKKDSIKA